MPAESTWADREILRIQALPNADLIIEIHHALNGHTYSWKSIQRHIQAMDISDDIYHNWNGLCNLKQTWDSIPSSTRERQHKDVVQGFSRDQSHQEWDLKNLRMLLVDLRLILIQAGVQEEQAIRLVSQNIDESSNGNTEETENDSFIGTWDSTIDEETPLLAQKVVNRTSWIWRKLLSWI